MKLHISIVDFQQIIGAQCFGDLNSEQFIQELIYDTRKITHTNGVAFFALKGPKNDGHNYLEAAYHKGIRHFVVQSKPNELLAEATYYVVSDSLAAIQKLATNWRQKINYPILAISGSIGKTTVKEWIHHLLAGKLRIARSPKSYNSQLGVALSLLELPLDADLALIEAAVTKPGEMLALQAMIQPQFGILTNCLLRGNTFKEIQQFSAELNILFKDCTWVLEGEKFPTTLDPSFKSLAAHIPFKDPASVQNAQIALKVALQFAPVTSAEIERLPRLALRLETFEGINDSLLVNDSYTIDIIAFEGSLAYLKSIANNKKTMVCCYLGAEQREQRIAIENLIQAYQIDDYFIWNQVPPVFPNIEQRVVLVKGDDKNITEKILANWRLKKHSTHVSYDLSALRHNLRLYQQHLDPKTKLLVMVKAQAYGAGQGQWVEQLVRTGVNYFGVAYADEGQELRKAGIQLPILVMNPEPETFDTCIASQLEPAIYSLDLLDLFIRKLIAKGLEAYPIHLKLDTGMHRLGFQPADITVLTETLAAQPEVQVKSIYSHMACADEPTHPHNRVQIELFEQMSLQIMASLPYTVLRHLLNSEGAAHFPAAQYDMVRLGIGLFGINHDAQFAAQLKPVLSWRSSISQLKTLDAGACVGYGCSRLNQRQKIAIIPVGYADGFKRNLSEGQGGVYINGQFCPTVGRVCMDMIMVAVDQHITINDEVEIIGPHQTLNDFAKAAQTIPYEILTSISARVPRTYIND